MSLPLIVVDAFASEPFRGNPAAVVLLPAARDQQWMQSIAMEMNLSETAFVYPDGDHLRLRWMTPAVEVDLCGHATIAATHAIRELHSLGTLPADIAKFWINGAVQYQSRSGLLTAESSAHGITLDFPATNVEAAELPAGIAEALGVPSPELVFVGRSKFDYLIQVSSGAIVRGLHPDMKQLATLPVRGLIVTALGDESSHDFISRFFAPGAGVDEDPVTGSAHCALAPFWAPHFGRATLFGYQASKRGGLVRMELSGNRVRLSGKAVTVSRGELVV